MTSRHFQLHTPGEIRVFCLEIVCFFSQALSDIASLTELSKELGLETGSSDSTPECNVQTIWYMGFGCSKIRTETAQGKKEQHINWFWMHIKQRSKLKLLYIQK